MCPSVDRSVDQSMHPMENQHYLSLSPVRAHGEWPGTAGGDQVDGVRKATPLLLCLVCIEMSDFVFAVDSIPAVLGISHDTFVVYASNVSIL